MKKHMTLVLSLYLMIVLLTACGSANAPSSTSVASAEPAASAEYPNCKGNVTEYGWAEAFLTNDPAKFAALFHENISQGAATAPGITFGAETIAGTFAWASTFYEYCNFTHQAVAGNQTYLEWELQTKNNMPMTGITILTKDADGKIINAINGHRNLMEISIYLEHFIKGPEDMGILQYTHLGALQQYGLEAKYARRSDSTLKVEGINDVFVDAFMAGTAEKFKEILADDVALSGGYMVETLTGSDNVASVLAATANYFEHCIFTYQAENDNRVYLQYEGRLINDMPVNGGFLVLVRDDKGKITEIGDNLMPLNDNTILSAYLYEINKGTDLEKYFYRDTLFAEAVEKYGLDNVYGEYTGTFTGTSN